jgi:hypothetical protein
MKIRTIGFYVNAEMYMPAGLTAASITIRRISRQGRIMNSTAPINARRDWVTIARPRCLSGRAPSAPDSGNVAARSAWWAPVRLSGPARRLDLARQAILSERSSTNFTDKSTKQPDFGRGTTSRTQTPSNLPSALAPVSSFHFPALLRA